VVRTIPPANYVIQKSKRSQSFVVHVDKLKKCSSPAPRSWSLDNGDTKVGQLKPSTQTDGEIGNIPESPRTQEMTLAHHIHDHASFTPVRPERILRKTPAWLSDYIC